MYSDAISSCSSSTQKHKLPLHCKVEQFGLQFSAAGRTRLGGMEGTQTGPNSQIHLKTCSREHEPRQCWNAIREKSLNVLEWTGQILGLNLRSQWRSQLTGLPRTICEGANIWAKVPQIRCAEPLEKEGELLWYYELLTTKKLLKLLVNLNKTYEIMKPSEWWYPNPQLCSVLQSFGWLFGHLAHNVTVLIVSWCS